MHDTRRTRIVLGVLVAAALALITIDYRGGGSAPLGGLRALGSSVFGSVEGAANVVTRPVAAFTDGLTGSGSQGKIDALQRQVVDLRAQLNQQRLSKYDERQLSQLLQLAGRGPVPDRDRERDRGRRGLRRLGHHRRRAGWTASSRTRPC